MVYREVTLQIIMSPIRFEILLSDTHFFGVTLFVSGLQGPVHAEEDHPGHQQDQNHPAIRIQGRHSSFGYHVMFVGISFG